jgi:hypothetical protein
VYESESTGEVFVKLEAKRVAPFITRTGGEADIDGSAAVLYCALEIAGSMGRLRPFVSGNS